MASLTDILSALQNGVVAINTLNKNIGGVYNNLTTSSIYQGPISSTMIQVLYASASGSASHIDSILFCNTTAGSLDVDISIVPPGGTASASNAVFFNMAIPANTTDTWVGKIIVPAGYSIQAFATGPGLTITISGGTSV